MTIDERKQMISRILAVRQTVDGEAPTVAEQSLWLWHQMAKQLLPLIGDAGFQALYARAVHFTLPHCPGFTVGKEDKNGDQFFKRLHDDLVAMEYGIAERCNTILLGKFTDLVASMIGEVLMDQILHSAWDARAVHKNTECPKNDK